MQFHLVRNVGFPVHWVHDEVVCLVVGSLRHVAIWKNHVGKSVVWPLLFFKRPFSGSISLIFLTIFFIFSVSTVVTV